MLLAVYPAESTGDDGELVELRCTAGNPTANMWSRSGWF